MHTLLRFPGSWTSRCFSGWSGKWSGVKWRRTGCWVLAELKCQVTGEPGEGGATAPRSWGRVYILWAHDVKTTTHCLCSFHPSATNKKQAESRAVGGWVHGERQRRRESWRGARRVCEWNGGSSPLTGFFFFFYLSSALATAPDQPKLYWLMRNPMWLFGPIRRLWCRT